MFCRSDQKIICYLCSMEEHKDHDTVSAAAERTERQRALEGSRHNIQQKIQEREKDLKLLQELKAMTRSADKTVERSQMIFTQLIHLMQEKCRDVGKQVRSQQEAEMRRVQELEKKLEQEIRELKRRDTELKKLSDTEDHSQFLQKVGVFLDHSAGFLAFYSVSETMTLLHRVQTRFTQPLHAGLRLWSGATAEFCPMKQ
ncbi:uncharacterized protein V6R79_014816 [Siganus canaliculatus]